MIDPHDIENRFDFHPATTVIRRETHEAIRAKCKVLAHNLNGLLPDGREKSIVMTKIEEVMFWANAAVARQKD